MTDLSDTILANSDQLNADDIIGQEPIIKIINVSKVSGDQPISIEYEGANGKPWKPCKSMRRVLVAAWGKDGTQYIGRSIHIYRDPSVKYAGKEVGGVRIKAMSHIDKPLTVSLAETRGKKKPYIVAPLQVHPERDDKFEAARGFVDKVIVELESASSADDHNAILLKNDASLQRIESGYPALYDKLRPILNKYSVDIDDQSEPVVGAF